MPRRGRTDRTVRWRRRLDRATQPVMVALAYAVLVVVACGWFILLAATDEMWGVKVLAADQFEAVEPVLAVMALLWSIFAVEMLARLLLLDAGHRSWRRVVYQLLCLALPPFRIGLTPATCPNAIWLPVLRWRPRHKPLRKELARYFSVPMIFFAIAILPVLGIEFYLYTKQITPSAALAIALNLTTQVVWLAFAVEFFTRLAADEQKIAYCKEHWIDAAIVLFPLVSFLRAMRLAALGPLLQTGRLHSMSRIYRLRGLAQRGYQALLVLRVLERWSLWGARARIRTLRRRIEKKHEEIEDIEEEIAELQHIIAEARRARADIRRAQLIRRRAQRQRQHAAERRRAADASGRPGTAAGDAEAPSIDTDEPREPEVTS